MLQWMGGSRRKVATSRKSTQKRQRQYFEQRKRQQQQQQATGLETFSNGVTMSSQRVDNNKSLDILSLLNLSTVAPYRKSSCPSGRRKRLHRSQCYSGWADQGGRWRLNSQSRKSTQKRQRQYFEQRKRQQQQQQATGLETFSNGVTMSSQRVDNNKSLDILSLLNLSTVAPYRKSSCPSAREKLGSNAMIENYHTSKCPTIQDEKVAPPLDPGEFNEARNPPACQVETVCPKKILSSDQSRHLSGHGDRTDQLKMPIERELSVFDLLGDGGPNDSLQESPKHEAHVAFAIEGLGKVQMETPVHSPQQSAGIFSSPLKAARKHQLCKNFDDLLYDLDLDVGSVSQEMRSGSFLEVPLFSRGTANSFSEPKQKSSTTDGYSRYNINANSLKTSFTDDEMSYNIADENEDIWKDGDFLEKGCDITWNSSALDMDGSSDDYWNIGSHEMSDFALEGPCFKKSMVPSKVRGTFNISDSPRPHSRQRISNSNYDSPFPGRTWNANVGKDSDFRDITNQPSWSCHPTEDTGESLSMLSEESCSSSAVWNKATKRSPSNPVARQNIRRHINGISSSANRCNGEKCAKDRYYVKSDDLREGKRINGPQKLANPSSSNPALFCNTVFNEKLGPEDSFSFDEGYITGKMDSGFNSFCQSSWAEKRAAVKPKIWTEDPFGAYPLPDVYPYVESSIERSKHDILHELSASRNFSSEEFAFCKPYSHDNSYGTPVSSTIGSLRCKKSLFTDSKVGGRPQDLFPTERFQGAADFLPTAVEVSVAKDGEKRSEKQLSACGKVELQNDICIGSNDLSSKTGSSLETSESKDNCADCKEVQDVIPETMNQKADHSPEHTEEISSCMKSHKLDDIIDEKEYHKDVPTSLLRQNGSTDDSGAKEMGLESKGQNIDPSCQVMMLESYVLQLLCVQKVLKEASVHDPMKKV